MRSAFIVSECGTGKSLMGAAIAHAVGRVARKDRYRVLVLGPPHLTRFGKYGSKWHREIIKTAPAGVRVIHIETHAGLLKLPRIMAEHEGPLWLICSRNFLKTTPPWRAAYTLKRMMVTQKVVVPGGGTMEIRSPQQVCCCPQCGVPAADKDGVPMPADWVKSAKRQCKACRGKLWQYQWPMNRKGQPVRTKPVYMAASWMKRHVRFDAIVADECFPPGTRITTPSGQTNIEDVRPGDMVMTHLGARRVTRLIAKRRATPLVRVTHERGSFVCTEGHKVYVHGLGLCKAKELHTWAVLAQFNGVNSDHAHYQQDLPGVPYIVQDVAKGPERAVRVQPGVLDRSAREGRLEGEAAGFNSKTEVYFTNMPTMWEAHDPGRIQAAQKDVLWSSMLNSLQVGARRGKGGSAQARHQQDGSPEASIGCSHAASECRPKHSGKDECHEEGEAVRATSPRQWLHHERTAVTRRRLEVATRISRQDGEPFLEVREAGLGESRTQGGHRDRRSIPSDQATEGARSSQGGHAQGSRLDGSTILELTGGAGSDRLRGGCPPALRSRVIRVEPVPTIDTEWVFDLEVEEAHTYYANDILVSNCHELKGGGTAQGQMLGTISACGDTLLAMTGTLFTGKASDLYYLCWRICPDRMRALGFHYRQSLEVFTRRYGIMQRTVERDDEETGVKSKAKSGGKKLIEKPGIVPTVFTDLLLDRAVFLSLDDLVPHLPAGVLPPRPKVELYAVPMDAEMMVLYSRMNRQITDAIREKSRGGGTPPMCLVAALFGVLDCWPDHPFGFKDVTCPTRTMDGETRHDVVCQVPDLPDVPWPKDVKLLSLLKAEIAAGRRCLVYTVHTQLHPVGRRIMRMLEAAGIKAAALEDVPTDRREEWIDKRREEGVQVIVTHPGKVETGLDLLDFPTIIFHSMGTKPFTFRQAGARAWRIGQRQACRTIVLAYASTMQQRIAELMFTKLRAAAKIEGQSLDALSSPDDAGDITDALLREIMAAQPAAAVA